MGWQIPRPTGRLRGRSRSARGSTGSATRPVASSTSARPSPCARDSTPTSRTSRACTPAPSTWSPRRPVSSGRSSTPRSRRSSSSTPGSRSSTRASTSSTATTSRTRGSRSRSPRSSRASWSCAGPSARACATSARTATRGRFATRSTPCSGSSRCGRAVRVCSGAPRRSVGPACSVTSASAPRPASTGSAPRSTGRSSTTSWPSWAVRPRASPGASRSACARRPRRRSTSSPPGSATTSPHSTGCSRSRRSCSATAPTPTCSDSRSTRSRSPCRSSPCAADASVASGDGSPTVADDTDVPELVQRALVTLYGESASEAVPRQVLVPELPADADVVTELLSELRGGPVTIRVPRRGDKKRLIETVEQNAHQSMARHKLKRAGDLTARSKALEELQDVSGPAHGTAAHRVLRRLQPPGHRDRRVDGGVRGRFAAQVRVPPLHDPARGPERRRRHARGHHPPARTTAQGPRGGRR